MKNKIPLVLISLVTVIVASGCSAQNQSDKDTHEEVVNKLREQINKAQKK